MPDDVFNTTTPAPVADQPNDVGTPPVIPDNIFADQLGAIKNTDGSPKYDSVEKALEALAQSQLHIAKLEGESVTTSTELVSLREQVSKAETVEEVVARLTANQEPTVQATPQPVVDEAAITTLVQNALVQDRANLTKQSNVSLVQSTLVSKYGDSAADVITAKAVELGITNDALREMASVSPKVALALFDTTAVSRDLPTSTSINLGSTVPADKPLERPTKSLLMGATSKEQADFMATITADVYKKHNVET